MYILTIFTLLLTKYLLIYDLNHAYLGNEINNYFRSFFLIVCIYIYINIASQYIYILNSKLINEVKNNYCILFILKKFIPNNFNPLTVISVFNP